MPFRRERTESRLAGRLGKLMRTPAVKLRRSHLIPWLIAHKASSKEKQFDSSKNNAQEAT